MTINRMTKTLFLAVLMLTMSAASAMAYSFTTFWATGSDAYDLETSFLAGGTEIGTTGFETFAPGSTGPLDLGFGELTGGGYVSDSTGTQVPYGEFAVQGENFFSNGAVGSTQGKGTYTISLYDSRNSVGFFSSDPLDIGGVFDLTVSGAGGTETVHLRDIVGPLNNGELLYFALVADQGFDALTFSTSNNDGYGIDQLSVANTPIPGAGWLLGAGMLGLLGFRRLRNRL